MRFSCFENIFPELKIFFPHHPPSNTSGQASLFRSYNRKYSLVDGFFCFVVFLKNKNFTVLICWKVVSVSFHAICILSLLQ